MTSYYPGITIRNNSMAQDYRDGLSVQEIAVKYELSRQRAGVILRETMPDYVRRYKMPEEKRAKRNVYYQAQVKKENRLSLYDSINADKQWQKLGVQF